MFARIASAVARHYGPETHKNLLVLADAISAGAILASFAKLLPPIAALAGAIWYMVQIWESDTVQHWVYSRRIIARRRKRTRAQRHRARLRPVQHKDYRPPFGDA